MNLSAIELLRTRATFMCLWSVLTQARSMWVSGCVKIDWNASDGRLEGWVEKEILPPTVLQFSEGFLTLQDGEIVGAKIGDGSSDLDQSLNVLMQMCYGIGCGVLPSTILTLCESEIKRTDIVGKFYEFNIQSRLLEIETEVAPLQYV
ncbi:MAG TPA: hypothetical protein VK308_02430 [Pyrinomonadaceae bacterium]|nr:hypothetical protein [Pyrinomonadaceae bacterium]